MKSLIKKISIKHGEPFNGRIVEVKCKNDKSFKTPTKIPSTTEIQAKHRIKHTHEWQSKIYEISQSFFITKISELSNPKKYGNKMDQLKGMKETLPDSAITMYYTQIGDYTELTNKDIENIVDFQLDAGFDIIILPENCNASLEEFELNFNRFFDYVNIMKPESVIMPQIRLRQKNSLFKEKLSLLSEYEGYLKAINISYSMFMHLKKNIHTLSKFSDHEFWIHTSNCTRLEMNRLIPTSTQHILQKYGMDTFSCEIPLSRQNLYNRKIDEILYFNPKTLIVSELNENMDNGYLRCNCPICRRHKFEYLCENLEKRTNQTLLSALNDFSKIHELYTSIEEFRKSRMYIEENRLMDYFKLKVGLQKFIKD